jgi:DNA gyrase subunit A
VIRTRVEEVRATGRDTMGVALMNLAEGDSVVAIARGETSVEGEDEDEGEDSDGAGDGAGDEVSAGSAGRDVVHGMNDDDGRNSPTSDMIEEGAPLTDEQE